jgi:hypothetical protein
MRTARSAKMEKGKQKDLRRTRCTETRQQRNSRPTIDYMPTVMAGKEAWEKKAIRVRRADLLSPVHPQAP